jgi:hypothetical protein
LRIKVSVNIFLFFSGPDTRFGLEALAFSGVIAALAGPILFIAAAGVLMALWA